MLFMQTPESTEFSTTFVMREEDHTLGNAIRYALNQKYVVDTYSILCVVLNFFLFHTNFTFPFGSPDVTFCGYSVPHPLENKMHVHIQTKGDCFIVASFFSSLSQDLVQGLGHRRP